MIFFDVDSYLGIFWSGDYEYTDKRIEILFSKNRRKSEIITGRSLLQILYKTS